MSLHLSLLPHGLCQLQLRHDDETRKSVHCFPYLLHSNYHPLSVVFTTAASCCCLCVCFLSLCTVRCTAWLNTPSNLLTCIWTVTFYSTLHYLHYSRPLNRVKDHEAYWNSYYPCWFFTWLNCSAICSYLLIMCNCVQREDGWTWAETCSCVCVLTVKSYSVFEFPCIIS